MSLSFILFSYSGSSLLLLIPTSTFCSFNLRTAGVYVQKGSQYNHNNSEYGGALKFISFSLTLQPLTWISAEMDGTLSGINIMTLFNIRYVFSLLSNLLNFVVLSFLPICFFLLSFTILLSFYLVIYPPLFLLYILLFLPILFLFS